MSYAYQFCHYKRRRLKNKKIQMERKIFKWREIEKSNSSESQDKECVQLIMNAQKLFKKINRFSEKFQQGFGENN